MKLVHPDWEKQIEWENTTIPVVIIENPEYYFQVLEELYNQVHHLKGQFILSEKDCILDFSKQGSLILSPWDLNFEDRRIMTELFSRFKKVSVGEKYYRRTCQLTDSILQYADMIGMEFSIPITYDTEIDVMPFLKALHLRIDNENLSLPDRMIMYMDVCTELFGDMCFIFNGFHELLSREQLLQFYHTVFDKHFCILLMEGHEYNILEEEETMIFDKDLCQIF